MQITIQFFASIREQVGKSSATLELPTPLSVREVWQAATGMAIPVQMLSAINCEYVSHDQLVTEGDEVAFFPPVTGG